MCVRSTDIWVPLNHREVRHWQREAEIREITSFFSCHRRPQKEAELLGSVQLCCHCDQLGALGHGPLLIPSSLCHFPLFSPDYGDNKEVIYIIRDTKWKISCLNPYWKLPEKPFTAQLRVSVSLYFNNPKLFWNYLLQHLSLTYSADYIFLPRSSSCYHKQEYWEYWDTQNQPFLMLSWSPPSCFQLCPGIFFQKENVTTMHHCLKSFHDFPKLPG